jgi:hypothetical protein
VYVPEVEVPDDHHHRTVCPAPHSPQQVVLLIRENGEGAFRGGLKNRAHSPLAISNTVLNTLRPSRTSPPSRGQAPRSDLLASVLQSTSIPPASPKSALEASRGLGLIRRDLLRRRGRRERGRDRHPGRAVVSGPVLKPTGAQQGPQPTARSDHFEP